MQWSLTCSRNSQGGGVFVASNGVANFEGCNIHDNAANYVCLHLELYLNVHPSPGWKLHHLLVLCWQCYYDCPGGTQQTGYCTGGTYWCLGVRLTF